MNFKNRWKVFQRTIARHGLHGTTWLINKLPYKVVRSITGAFSAIGYCFIIKQRRIAEKSIDIAFGNEKSPEEIKKITRACFDNVGRSMMQLIYFMAHPHMIDEKVSFEGKENLDNALKQGKGVVGVSAHFGSFPLMLISLARSGYATNAIIRRTRDVELEEYFQGLRTSLGLKTIYAKPRTTCVEQSIKALRNNEFVFIPLDQNFGSGRGVFVDFFGQKAATATGPVVFAKRTKAPILPVFVIRENEDNHRVIIEKPIVLEDRDNDDEYMQVNIQKITDVIEKYIRKYPQEWGWMHRRWKTKPKG